MAAIKIAPLTTTVAARVDGINLQEPITAEEADSIRKALATHAVLVFENQPLDLEQQKAVAQIFGELTPTPAHALLGITETLLVVDNQMFKNVANPEYRISDIFMLRDEFQGWHTDACFSPQIPSVGCMRVEVIPPVGGGTTWASMGAAYDALSPTMRDWMETLSAVYSPGPAYRAHLRLHTYSKETQEAWDRNFSTTVHPLVVRHPVNGRKMLFVNPAFCVKIEGLSNNESATILRFLFNHIATPDFVYRHRWNDGDVVIWDELATVHLAPKDYLPHPRRLVQFTAGLATPMAARPPTDQGIRRAS